MKFDFIDWFAEQLLYAVVTVLFALFFLSMPLLFYTLYLDSKSPRFTLKKDEWTCISYIRVNGPGGMSHEECTNWTRMVPASKAIKPEEPGDV